MENSKLIKVLKSLDKKNLKRFGEFVHSPFFNKNENIMILFDTLAKYSPGFDSKKVQSENIYKKVFPGAKFDYYKLKNLASDLYYLTKTYFKIIANEKNDVQTSLNLLRELHGKNLDMIYDQTEKEVKSELEGMKVQDEDYYFLKYRLNKENTSHYLLKNSYLHLELLQPELDNFLQYSLTNMMRLYTKVLYNKNHGKIDYKMEIFDVLWKYICVTDYENNPLYMIYKSIINLERSKDEKDYKELLKLKNKYKENISDDDMYNILIFMNSFISYRLNKFGDENYYKDRFEVLKETISRGFMTSTDISYTDYTYVFISATTVGEFEWAEKFRDEFQKGISPAEEKNNSVNFCNGFLNYRKKNFDKALEYFSLTNFKLFFMKVTVKSIMVRIYYETNMYEQCLSAIDTFKHYLSREKLILEDQKKAHFDFLKYTGALFKLKMEKGKKKNNPEFIMIKKQISQMDSSTFGVKNWLLKKLDEFK